MDWGYIPIWEDQIIVKCRVLRMNGLPPRTYVICSFLYLSSTYWASIVLDKLDSLADYKRGPGYQHIFMGVSLPKYDQPSFSSLGSGTLFRVPLFICPLTLIYISQFLLFLPVWLVRRIHFCKCFKHWGTRSSTFIWLLEAVHIRLQSSFKAY